jgi:methionyl-tRNA synthetase
MLKRRAGSSPAPGTNFYMKTFITSSIPYVNGPPHLGHAMEFTIVDVLARYSRLKGEEVLLSIGTDEHGGKIAESAEKQGLTPQQFTDRMSQEFKRLAEVLEISNDRFIRTTDKDHEQRVQKVWSLIQDDLYKKQYQAWYCTGDEAFFSDAVVEKNNHICPEHNRPYERITEENYFFKLSKYNQQIKDIVQSNEFLIIPETKRNEILSLLSEGLEDISVSRPKSKIYWGIPVPNDDSQVIYVWFEALLNYITVLGFPDQPDFREYWPATYQVIGKDIIRFHAAIWPAILMSLKIATPKKLYVHGFINVDNLKMSKSLGNSIDPFEIVDKYGADSFRYYFLRHIPSYDDGNFSWEGMDSAYNSDLGNELGNGVQRTAVMIKNYLDGKLPDPEIVKIYDSGISELIESCRFDKALEQIWLRIKNLNQFIEEQKPWALYKFGEQDKLEMILNSQVKSLREIGFLLKPFMPETSEKINVIFGDDKLNLSEQTLFPRLELKVNADS